MGAPQSRSSSEVFSTKSSRTRRDPPGRSRSPQTGCHGALPLCEAAPSHSSGRPPSAFQALTSALTTPGRRTATFGRRSFANPPQRVSSCGIVSNAAVALYWLEARSSELAVRSTGLTSFPCISGLTARRAALLTTGTACFALRAAFLALRALRLATAGVCLCVRATSLSRTRCPIHS